MPATLPASDSARRHAAFVNLAVITAVIYAVELFVVRSSRFALHPQLLSGAVVLDLTVGIPTLYWVMIVRPGHARASTILAAFLVSVLGARLVLPVTQHQFLAYERLLAVPVELGIIAYVIVKVRCAGQALRGAPATLDVPERIDAALHDAFPNPIVGRLLATELTLGWYALASWRRAPHVGDATAWFSYHRKNGLIALLAALIGVTAVELLVVHLLVHAYSARAAWALSAVSGIGIVWLLGFVRALVLRPVLLYPDRLVVRGGIQWTADVPRAAIESVEHGWTVRAPGKRTPGYLRATPLVQPNLMLRLRTPVEARGMYGRRRAVHLIGLSVDDPAALAEALRREG